MTALLISIFNMSLSASIVALIVLLVRIPLKKAPKIYSYALWSLVIFRLLCPFSFNSNISLMPISTQMIKSNIVYDTSGTIIIQSGVYSCDVQINKALDNILPAVSADGTNPIRISLEIAAYIWICVLTALLAYVTIGYIRLKRRVYYATLIRKNIYETDQIDSPFVLGFINPKIYIPTTLNITQYDYILNHEEVHIKRRDYIIKPIAFFALAVHWFNPLIWLCYFLMAKDMEMSCDEAVLRKSNEDLRGEYSSLLLGLAAKNINLMNPLAFGESNVKARVKNVLHFKKSTWWITVISLVVLLIVFVGFTPNNLDKELISSTNFSGFYVPGAGPQIENVRLPSFGGNEFYTKTAPAMSEEEYEETIAELAKKDAISGNFHEQSSEYLSLMKSFISVVSPDRKMILTDALVYLFENQSLPSKENTEKPLLGIVNFSDSKNELLYAEFLDDNGEEIAHYARGRWLSFSTQAENARSDEFFAIYYFAWKEANAAINKEQN